MQESGIDLVELTGNHNNDWSRASDTYTINLYKQNNMAYFGGGLNLEDARKPYITEIKGTRIGFLGYNYYDAIVSKNSIPLASSSQPGANPYDEEQVEADIKALESQVDIIVVDIQFQECWCYSEGNTTCYRPNAVPNQEKVFQQAIEWGADIVVGTQAHQPQGFEMRADGAIFYGLGNLYFDQTVYTGTKEEEILKHYFYNGAHLTTRVYTAFYDKDYQPYLTSGDSRTNFLKKVFKASGYSF
jgi:poly-gamma-glutamate synthesis protein (capsule biosynthesis protein)